MAAADHERHAERAVLGDLADRQRSDDRPEVGHHLERRDGGPAAGLAADDVGDRGLLRRDEDARSPHRSRARAARNTGSDDVKPTSTVDTADTVRPDDQQLAPPDPVGQITAGDDGRDVADRERRQRQPRDARRRDRSTSTTNSGTSAMRRPNADQPVAKLENSAARYALLRNASAPTRGSRSSFVGAASDEVPQADEHHAAPPAAARRRRSRTAPPDPAPRSGCPAPDHRPSRSGSADENIRRRDHGHPAARSGSSAPATRP